MEHFFTYEIVEGDDIARIGKGHTVSKSPRAVIRYLRSRYGAQGWASADVAWHASEAAALKRERRAINEHVDIYGVLPPRNRARGGGGRQIYAKCKAYTVSGQRCCNDALEGNYGFCGVHR